MKKVFLIILFQFFFSNISACENSNYVKKVANLYIQKELGINKDAYELADVTYSFTKKFWVLMYQSKKLEVGKHFFLKIYDDIDDIDEIEYIPGL